MTPIFETERLYARPYTLEDAPAAFEVYRDPEVARFIRNAPEESVETQRATLEWILNKYGAMEPGFGFWALVEKETDTVVGSVVLKPLPGHPEIEVGWHLARRVWGKGYATEAGRACIEHGFKTFDMPRIVAVVNPLNTRSSAVALRLGMRPEGMVSAYNFDLNLYVLDRPE
jgi:RimJ/RimL family protein N-acetyltransferase